jgi:polysaccharide export outer membrane protein
MTSRTAFSRAMVVVLALALPAGASATLASAQAAAPEAGTAPAATPPVATPADYVIGAGDVLSIVFWRDQDLSGEVTVRPDGKITVPLLKDIDAAGLTPAELEKVLQDTAKRFVQDPNATVVVRQIHSRNVFITGNVARAGSYPLNSPTTVLQLIAIAGGLLEYADAGGILIMRTEGGKPTTFKFNYKDVSKGKALAQNIPLRPGDTVIVP